MFPSYWLKWYLVCSNFSFTSLSAVQIYVFHIFLAVYSSLHGFIWKQHNDQLPVGFLAQFVERCTGIAEVMGSNPVQAWMFFSGLIFTNARVVCIIAKITFIHVFIRSSNIWLSYILNHLFITSRVYLEPTSWPAPSWLVSSFGRALHRYRRGHGFKFRAHLNFFFRPCFHYCSSSVHYCEVTFIHVFICSSKIWLSYILSPLFITSRVCLEPA